MLNGKGVLLLLKNVMKKRYNINKIIIDRLCDTLFELTIGNKSNTMYTVK